MTETLKNCQPHLAPFYIYGLLVALLPVAAIIDLFVAPSIHWQSLYLVPLMAAIYGGFFLYFSHVTGPFETAPLWARALRIFTELMLLYTLTSNCLPLMDQMVKINSWPLADAWLAKADAMIGFDWLAYFNFVHDRPVLFEVLDHAYAHTGILSFALTLALIALGKFKRIQFHMEAVVWTVLISILISAVTPAYAAAVFYGIDFTNYPNFGFAPGVYHVENLYHLRAASPDYRIGAEPFKGLITFPSVHTALGVVMAGALWRHWLFWPTALYTLVMIPSTPVLGSHYLIDVIAGAALAILVMVCLAKRAPYANLFIAKSHKGQAPIPAE
ncbi:MAG: phosphatase PAP2 family protein [Pseudomonadota bacterium]